MKVTLYLLDITRFAEIELPDETQEPAVLLWEDRTFIYNTIVKFYIQTTPYRYESDTFKAAASLSPYTTDTEPCGPYGTLQHPEEADDPTKV